jgi:hypothetical protein
MKSTYQSIVIDAPIETVWERVKDFHDLSWASSVITKCVDSGDKKGTEVGAKRILNGVFYETLIEHDGSTHTVRYTIDDGPAPVSKGEVNNYVGCLHLLPVTKNNTTFVEWSSSWEADTNEAVYFCHNIYVALLDEMASAF